MRRDPMRIRHGDPEPPDDGPGMATALVVLAVALCVLWGLVRAVESVLL